MRVLEDRLVFAGSGIVRLQVLLVGVKRIFAFTRFPVQRTAKIRALVSVRCVFLEVETRPKRPILSSPAGTNAGRVRTDQQRTLSDDPGTFERRGRWSE